MPPLGICPFYVGSFHHQPQLVSTVSLEERAPTAVIPSILVPKVRDGGVHSRVTQIIEMDALEPFLSQTISLLSMCIYICTYIYIHVYTYMYGYIVNGAHSQYRGIFFAF